MKKCKNLAEWLESQGNPKHSIAEGENGSKVIAVENKSLFAPGVTVYNFRETELPNGEKALWVGPGWGIRKEYLPAIKGLIDKLEKEELPEDDYITFRVIEWRDDEDGEYERCIGTIRAVSEYHAIDLLRDHIRYGRFPKGSWLEYTLDGKEIGLDTTGRIPA
jgi:hypothetical protein